MSFYLHTVVLDILAGVCFVVGPLRFHSQKRNTHRSNVPRTTAEQHSSCFVQPDDAVLATQLGVRVFEESAR